MADRLEQIKVEWSPHLGSGSAGAWLVGEVERLRKLLRRADRAAMRRELELGRLEVEFGRLEQRVGRAEVGFADLRGAVRSQVAEALAVLERGTEYERAHVAAILRDALDALDASPRIVIRSGEPEAAG